VAALGAVVGDRAADGGCELREECRLAGACRRYDEADASLPQLRKQVKQPLASEAVGVRKP
jgi:hypothetical protein